MKFGFVLPHGDARTAAELAFEAEQAGWNGFFVWEPVWGVDAWICLTAAAMRTANIRLGTMITPLSRMRPWKLASETTTLDRLSYGRVILSVGLGALETGFEAFGEVTDRKTRTELLDEGLDILTGLWRGQPFSYAGKHYHIEPATFQPPSPPIQQPRIPIWVVGAWPWPKSLDRAMRYDGLLPAALSRDKQFSPVSPEQLKEINNYIAANRQASMPFDIVVEGTTPGNNPSAAAEQVRPFAENGATWWIEAMWTEANFELVRSRLRQGPPPL